MLNVPLTSTKMSSADVCTLHPQRTPSASAKTLQTSRAQPLHQAVDAPRLEDVLDLEIAGDDRAVAEQPPEQPLLDLHRADPRQPDRKSTRLNSSHVKISYAVFCLKKKKKNKKKKIYKKKKKNKKKKTKKKKKK